MANLQIQIIPVTPFQQNCTFMFDDVSRQAVIVDPGGEKDVLLQAIQNLDVKIEQIWLTHGHIDHVGAAMDLKDALGVDIIGPHIDDKFLLDDVVGKAKSYHQMDWDVRNVTPDQWLHEGDQLKVADFSFNIYHTPGHSPGHVIFVNHALKFIIMGDVLFQGSVGRTDLPGGNHAQLMTSIRDKVLPLGDDFSFICGHGPMSKVGIERKTNPFLIDL